LGSGSPVWFLAELGRRGMKLRRHHQGPNAGGAHSPWDLREERATSRRRRGSYFTSNRRRRAGMTQPQGCRRLSRHSRLEVAARGDYDATAVASGLGTPGPPCPFRPTLRVAGELEISSGKELFRETRQRLLGAPRAWQLASTRKRNPPDARQIFLLAGLCCISVSIFFAKEKSGLGNLVS